MSVTAELDSVHACGRASGIGLETPETIGAWADETFGKINIFATITRASEELVELGRALSRDAPAEEVRVEAADVVIVLIRVTRMSWEEMRAAIPKRLATCLCEMDKPSLIGPVWGNAMSTLGEMTYWQGEKDAMRAAVVILESVTWIYAAMAHICRVFGGDLHREIDLKMAINRKRKWAPAGDGCSYHIPDPPA